MEAISPLIHGRYRIYSAGAPLDPSLLLEKMGGGRIVHGKGRGGIRLFSAGKRTIACRKYTHGGLLRALTGDLFLSQERARSELAITIYLRERGFPVVEPFAAIAKKGPLFFRLWFLTVYSEDATDLLQFLVSAVPRKRLRTIRRLAELFFLMETLGVRHPDLHLNNVLVAGDGRLLFLDFDKSTRGQVTTEDMVCMFFRLNRYAEKMERKGIATFTEAEKVFFLRSYRRVSGQDLLGEMKRRVVGKRRIGKAGWLLERLLYRQ